MREAADPCPPAAVVALPGFVAWPQSDAEWPGFLSPFLERASARLFARSLAEAVAAQCADESKMHGSMDSEKEYAK